MNYQYLLDVLHKKKREHRRFHIINCQQDIDKHLSANESKSDPKLFEFCLNKSTDINKIPDLISYKSEKENFIITVGNVLTINDIEECLSYGINVFFSSTFDYHLFHYCCLRNCILIPGVYTPSEVMEAYKNGARILKFFPCGTDTSMIILRHFQDLFFRLENIQFIASGGIKKGNIKEIFSHKNILAIAGSRLEEDDINI